MFHIYPIFADPNPDKGGLFAIRFDDETRNAYEDFKACTDGTELEALYEMVDSHWDKLGPSSYTHFPTRDAARDCIIRESGDLRKALCDAATGTGKQKLHDVFEPLSNSINQSRHPFLAKAEKVKHKLQPKILRVYGIQITANIYVMTGWSLKLANRMEDYQEGKDQLDRLEDAHAYLEYEDLFTFSDRFNKQYFTISYE